MQSATSRHAYRLPVGRLQVTLGLHLGYRLPVGRLQILEVVGLMAVVECDAPFVDDDRVYEDGPSPSPNPKPNSPSTSPNP